MDLHDLADFNLVAAHGGFGKASRASDRPKATLSRRVRNLEEGLGVRLLERGAHSLRLTQEGKTLFGRTEGLLAEIAEIGAEIGEGRAKPRGRLRVSAPVRTTAGTGAPSSGARPGEGRSIVGGATTSIWSRMKQRPTRSSVARGLVRMTRS